MPQVNFEHSLFIFFLDPIIMSNLLLQNGILDPNRIYEGVSIRVKDRQKAMVFHEILLDPTMTRSNARSLLGLRSSTVSASVKELLEDRLVVEIPKKTTASPGRPSNALNVNTDRFTVMSFYLENRYLIGAIVNLAGDVLSERKAFLPAETDNQVFIDKFINLKKKLSVDIPSSSELLGLGISPLGSVDVNRKIWIRCHRWPNIRDINFYQPPFSDLPVPIIVRRNLEAVLDYQMAANSLYRKGGTALFHWGLGIGGAFALDGFIIESSLGRFGDIGHTKVNPGSDLVCRCGGRGCLEAEAALWALLPELRNSGFQLDEDNHGFANALKGDWLINIPGVKHSIGAIGNGLYNFFKMLYPDRIILIGPFFENPLLAKKIIRSFKTSLPTHLNRKVSILVVEDAFHGCLFANAYPLFRDALKSFLISRS